MRYSPTYQHAAGLHMKRSEYMPLDEPVPGNQDRAPAVHTVIILWFATISAVLAGLVWLVARLKALG
jgi:hypothetical protein